MPQSQAIVERTRQSARAGKAGERARAAARLRSARRVRASNLWREFQCPFVILDSEIFPTLGSFGIEGAKDLNGRAFREIKQSFPQAFDCPSGNRYRRYTNLSRLAFNAIAIISRHVNACKRTLAMICTSRANRANNLSSKDSIIVRHQK